jgi:hypothetical protein
MPTFPEDTVFVATGPDFAAEALNLGKGTEQAIADILREHGPERVHLYVQDDTDGGLRLLTAATVHTGRDDIAKYYLTTCTDVVTGRQMQIGWDS